MDFLMNIHKILTFKSIFIILLMIFFQTLPTIQAQYVHLQTITPEKNESSCTPSIAFSPHKNLLAHASSKNSIKLYSLCYNNGENIFRIIGKLPYYPSRASGIAFSPDDVIASIWSKCAMIKIWSPFNEPNEPWKNIQDLCGYSNKVSSIAFSHCGTMLASGDCGSRIKIWHAQCRNSLWENTHTLRGHTITVVSLAFAPNNSRLLASGSADKTIKIWTFNAQKEEWVNIQTLAGHNHLVKSIAFSPNGKTLISGSWDNTIIIWTLQDNAQWVATQTLTEHTQSVNSVAFSPDEKCFISGSPDRTIIVWALQDDGLWISAQVLTEHTQAVMSVALSFDGEFIASSSYDNVVHIWRKNNHS